LQYLKLFLTIKTDPWYREKFACSRNCTYIIPTCYWFWQRKLIFIAFIAQ